MSAAVDPGVERRAAKMAKQRRVDRVRPGWWVYSYGARGGSWARVGSVSSFVDRRTGQTMVRLYVTPPDTGREVVIENVAGYPASCLTAAQATTAGLGGR